MNKKRDNLVFSVKKINVRAISILKKAKSAIGIAKHFFSNRDVDIQTKHSICNAFTINAAPWGCESWNLPAKNKKALESFHHGAIRRILNIKWEEVKKERIRNKQVRHWFCNTPKIESFINKRTATYVRKVTRSNDEELPKKLLGAWMHQPRKVGGQQLSCNNNFAKAISAAVSDTVQPNQGLLFRDWIPLTLDEKEWLNRVEEYFESCKNSRWRTWWKPRSRGRRKHSRYDAYNTQRDKNKKNTDRLTHYTHAPCTCPRTMPTPLPYAANWPPVTGKYAHTPSNMCCHKNTALVALMH
jgi:hypothetical protein